AHDRFARRRRLGIGAAEPAVRGQPRAAVDRRRARRPARAREPDPAAHGGRRRGAAAQLLERGAAPAAYAAVAGRLCRAAGRGEGARARQPGGGDQRRRRAQAAGRRARRRRRGHPARAAAARGGRGLRAALLRAPPAPGRRQHAAPRGAQRARANPPLPLAEAARAAGRAAQRGSLRGLAARAVAPQYCGRRPFRSGYTPPALPPQVEEPRVKIIIRGAGPVGASVAESLVSEANDITLVDTCEEHLAVLRERLEIRTVVGNGASPIVLRVAGAEDADLLI